MNSEEKLAWTEAELIAKILQGDRDLYAQIVRKYNQRLYRVGMAILNNESEIEDAMQVAYINAYENLPRFGFRASFSTWLTRILINECLFRLRKRKRNAMIDIQGIDNSMENLPAKNTKGPAEGILQSEMKKILEDAIYKLPKKYRIVFVMREIEEMNIVETKGCLGISEENVKVRLNRAKAMLRESLAEYYKDIDVLQFHLHRCDRITDRVMIQIRGRMTGKA